MCSYGIELGSEAEFDRPLPGWQRRPTAKANLAARGTASFARRSARPKHLDPRNDVALEDPVHDAHPANYFGEHGVVVVEAKVVDQIDEDLRIARVAPAGRDAERAASMRAQAKLVAHESVMPDVLVRPRTPALDHEIRRDPVEREVVVEATARQRHEARDRGRSIVSEQPELERAPA